MDDDEAFYAPDTNHRYSSDYDDDDDLNYDEAFDVSDFSDDSPATEDEPEPDHYSDEEASYENSSYGSNGDDEYGDAYFYDEYGSYGDYNSGVIDSNATSYFCNNETDQLVEVTPQMLCDTNYDCKDESDEWYQTCEGDSPFDGVF